MKALVILSVIGSVLLASCGGASMRKYSSRDYNIEDHMKVPKG